MSPVQDTSASRRRPPIRARSGPCGVILALGLVLLGSGCVAFAKGGLFPEDGDEVWVEYFDNRTFFRDVEFRLTEQVVAEVLSRPGLQLSRSREEAEVILSGRVTQVGQTVLSEDAARTVESVYSTVTVIVDVLDAATGEVLRTRQLSQRGEYVPPQGETDQTAREFVFELLARDIVRELETEF